MTVQTDMKGAVKVTRRKANRTLQPDELRREIYSRMKEHKYDPSRDSAVKRLRNRLKYSG